jgi:hypothetical protein
VQVARDSHVTLSFPSNPGELMDVRGAARLLAALRCARACV